VDSEIGVADAPLGRPEPGWKSGPIASLPVMTLGYAVYGADRTVLLSVITVTWVFFSQGYGRPPP